MLTLGQAEKAAKAALAAAEGAAITVVIVDDRGRDIYLARGDGAMWITPDIARSKAVTASAFGIATEQLKAMADQPWFSSLQQGVTKIWAGGGGVPITADGSVIGGIGISGGSEELDAKAAAAGAHALTA